MANIIILFSSTDGHTQKIADTLKQQLTERSATVDVRPLAEVKVEELNHYDSIIIGAAIRYGKHKPEVYEFIETHRQLLDQKISGFFSVCLVARKADKNTPQTNPYFKKFLQKSRWHPSLAAVFAGKINYPIYSWSDRLMIRFIMWLTKGPTAPDTVREFTDWKSIEVFADSIHDKTKSL